jgi:hypothetical protein
LLAALQATPPGSLYPLISTHLLDILHFWLLDAEQERQISFARNVLALAQQLPVSRPLLQPSRLLATVVSLTKSKVPRISQAARQAIQHWQMIHQGLILPSSSRAAGVGGAGRKPTKAAAVAVQNSYDFKVPVGLMLQQQQQPLALTSRAVAMAVPLGRQQQPQLQAALKQPVPSKG